MRSPNKVRVSLVLNSTCGTQSSTSIEQQRLFGPKEMKTNSFPSKIPRPTAEERQQKAMNKMKPKWNDKSRITHLLASPFDSYLTSGLPDHSRLFKVLSHRGQGCFPGSRRALLNRHRPSSLKPGVWWSDLGVVRLKQVNRSMGGKTLGLQHSLQRNPCTPRSESHAHCGPSQTVRLCFTPS